ncbi:tetratricopeptide repeat protein [Catenulispora sp. NF23]|uniref:AfsR/SARP family transcriptional regulator n=1 Tax=Catenulispora pinistramenti TaxID=2705254 RepID=UPI001BABDD3C|nr:BTAD domain-containing putative transcriptional regulator [Catenulispora pinistramenti]MBS2531655.1 tetratricopeptide repeat protein [Catenulispora pinistramenti]
MPGDDRGSALESAPLPGSVALKIRVLGPLLVTVDGQPIAIGGGRPARALVLLSLNANKVVPVGQVIDVLWDDPPESARQQVHNVVAAVRRALKPAVGAAEVLTVGSGYKLNVAKNAVDLLRFEALLLAADSAVAARELTEACRHLKEAIALWDGPALSGIEGRKLQNSAVLLTERRAAAIEQLAEISIEVDEAASVVAILTQLVADFPLRESLRAVLMRALYRSGRQADALAVYEDGRTRLAEELGLDPGPRLREAHQEVLTSGNAAVPPASDSTDPAAVEIARKPVPPAANFLPRDLAEFTGREAEIRRLHANAANSGMSALVISAIDGMGGVGKTTLAVHIAHQLADRYPDGQFFIDLQGFSVGVEPMSPMRALNSLLRSSGVPPEAIPHDLAARSALWRSTLTGRRALVLLDNALDVTQIRPLLPAEPGALVLIASRRRMAALEGAVPLSLDVMPKRDAYELFSHIAGADRVTAESDQVALVLELCGRLPLAIQIAAARLRDRPSWSVADLVGQLRRRSGRARTLVAGDRNVLTIIGWSYQHLPPLQKILFRRLGAHPGHDFDAYTAAALSGLPLEQAEDGLEELFDINLLQQRRAERYSFHDLVRDCAKDLHTRDDDDEARQSTLRRLLDYYLVSTDRWCRAMGTENRYTTFQAHAEPDHLKDVPDHSTALSLFEDEYRNIAASVKYAAIHGFDSHAWQLVCAMLPYFSRISQWNEAENLYMTALSAVRRLGLDHGESVCLMGLAAVKQSHGEISDARELISRAITISRARGDLAAEANQLTNLGVIFVDANNFAEGQKCFLGALDLAIQVGDLKLQSALTNNLGVISRELGRLTEALEFFNRSVDIEEMDDEVLHRSPNRVCNIAEVLNLQGLTSRARERYLEALELSRINQSPRSRALALTGLCAVYRASNDLSRAFDAGREAVDLARSVDWFQLEGDALSAIGDTHLSRGDLESAAQSYAQVKSIGLAYSSERYIARAREGMAHVALARLNVAEAKTCWREALAVYPGGVVDATAARLHLAADDPGSERCWRCRLNEDDADSTSNHFLPT